MSKRVPASVQTDQSIGQLLSGGSSGDVRSELIRLGVRRIVEEALEREVSDFLGRGFYQREGGEQVRVYLAVKFLCSLIVMDVASILIWCGTC